MLLFRESIRGFFYAIEEKAERGDYSRSLGSGSATIAGFSSGNSYLLI